MFKTKIDPEAISAIKQMIGEAKQIAITAHMSPDGDAIGSSLALMHILHAMGKNSRVVVPDDYPRQLAFLPGIKDVIIYCRNTRMATDYLRNCDLIFSLDHNDIARIDRMAPAVEGTKARKVMIDHHLNPGDYCDVTISHHELSSTCLLLLIVLTEAGLHDYIDADVATCLLSGMMTDTGNFSYNSNDPEIYRAISMLIERGADHDDLSRRLFDTFSESYLRLNGYAISMRMQVWKPYGAAMITLTREELNRYHYTRGDTEGLVNRPLAIPGMVYSIFLREEERYIKVSMRSKGDLPCDKICAKYFNGGGHLNAAGGEFYGSMSQAIEVVKHILPIIKEKYSN